MTPTIFRGLVVLSVLLSIASATIDALLPSLLPHALSQAYENVPLPAMAETPLWLVLLVPWLGVAMVSTVGLFFFKGWARLLSFLSTTFGFALYPLLGITLSSGWSSALSDASWVTWGAVLALAYYSPLSGRFVARATDER